MNLSKGISPIAGVAVVVVAIIIVAGLFVYMFSSAGVSTSTGPLATSSPTASGSTTVVVPTSFAFKNVTLQTPQTQPPCQGLLCQSNSELSGVVAVDASSPLSCIDVSLNGTSTGSQCWNLTSPSFTMSECNGSGNNTSCTAIISQNTYTETNRTFTLGYPIQSGGRGNIPAVVAGGTYLITLVAQFEDGSNATASATVVASVSTAPSGSGASCSGSPQGGGSNAAGRYSYTFPLTLNYSGPWTLTYQGYDSMGKSNPTSTSGGCSGTGVFGISVTVSGPTSDALTLCAQAQKLDSSNAIMTLTITGHNETSLPNGSVSYCGGVVP